VEAREKPGKSRNWAGIAVAAALWLPVLSAAGCGPKVGKETGTPNAVAPNEPRARDPARSAGVARSVAADDAAVNRVVSLMESMPAWSAVTPDAAERSCIERTCREVAAYDKDTIRAAVVRLESPASVARGDFAAREGRLFLLNRFLFDLPISVRRDSPHFQFFFASFWGLPLSGERGKIDPSDTVACRWPWSDDYQGGLRLEGVCFGYSGPPYDALRDFDYYRKTFGRRTPGEKERTPPDQAK
jgi:hypothetical protein